MNFKIVPVGEQALSLVLPNRIAPQINQVLQLVIKELDRKKLPGIIALVPAYHTLLVQFDLSMISADDLKKQLTNIMNSLGQVKLANQRVIELPVCYGQGLGPDIGAVAKFASVSSEELIRIHTQTPYLIHFLGFLPGFAYLGGLSSKIAMPRLATPRIKIPAGSVGIAGSQTGFYPVDSPGGWRIIGRTPVTLFSQRQPKSIYQAGDFIQFKAIDHDRFNEIQAMVRAGEYQWTIKEREVPECEE